MVIWHLTPDAPRFPFFVSAGQNVNLQFRTWPIEGGNEPGSIIRSCTKTALGIQVSRKSVFWWPTSRIELSG